MSASPSASRLGAYMRCTNLSLECRSTSKVKLGSWSCENTLKVSPADSGRAEFARIGRFEHFFLWPAESNRDGSQPIHTHGPNSAGQRCLGCEPALLVPYESVDRLGSSTPDQSRWAPFRGLEISCSHGAEWKPLISKYITTIPFSGDGYCVAEQRMSGGPTSSAPANSAIIAKVGAATRDRKSIAPAATLPLSQPIVARMHPPV